MSVPPVPVLTLNDGRTIPQLGLGVFKIDPSETTQVVLDAFELGYRHIDTARIYNNEEGVGQAVASSGIPREDLFITTKLWNDDQGTDTAFAAFEKSLERLGLDYVDLYLVHWPCPAKNLYVESWQALEKIRASGRARSIGVSNFLVPHLERLLKETHIVPVVDQIESHPAHQQPATEAFATAHSIAVESWGPLGQGKYPLLELPQVTSAAAAHDRSPAQVVLRWHIQRGHIVLPKSSQRARLAENISVFDFELSENEMAAITAVESVGRVGSNPNEMN
ncbi:MAG: 2,5-diketo-D-gluconic acid reductase [Candidatus Lumbricidophila eiseniae]|uniref:2,5-diketo-D-gluconic acid reductase n=1 Tax=Candidatus Lumbricidiphila eiseniae TaxID=1969409 RepID=A0A2A6FQU2_9MICO|nr:MAG: 2,5-diketo-D-gluconic acid reductase [Candidatus Lumbricidophila eiseniae]